MKKIYLISLLVLLFSGAGLKSQTVNFTKTNVTCFGADDGTLTATITGGTSTYYYVHYKTFQPSVADSFGPTTSLAHTFTGLEPDFYTIYVRDVVTQNVLDFNTLQITEPAILNATVSSTNITCYGGSTGTISITGPSGGSGSYEYSISGGSSWQTSGNYTGLSANTYVVMIRDRNAPGCTRTLNGGLVISQPLQLNATVNSTNVTCYNANNGTISITGASGGSGNYEYSITGGSGWQSSGNYTNLSAATYNVMIRDASYPTCTRSLGSLILTQPLALNGGTITVVKALTCYEGSDAILRANPSGGTAPYTYLWFFDTPVPPTSYANTGVTTRDYTTAGRGGYRCQISDANGCGPVNSATLSFIEFVNDSVPLPLTVSATTTPACAGQNNGTVTITGSGGWTPFSYFVVNSSSVTIGPQSSNQFTTLGADTYEPWITDKKGCTKKGTNVTVSSLPAPTVNAGPDGSTCVNAAYTISGASATNYSSLQWTIVSGAGALTNATTLTATYTPAAADAGTTVVLRLTANGNAPCAAVSDNRNLQVVAAPTVNAGPDGSACVNAAYTISGASATNYSSLLWTIVSGAGALTNATTLTATYTPAAADAGTTVVLRLTANGNAPCASASDNMNLQVRAAPTVNAGPDGSACVNTVYTISGASATNYSSLQWTIVSGAGALTNATTLTATYTPAPADAGTTVVLRLTANGNAPCASVSDNMNLQVVAAPTANAGPDASTCVNVAHTISGASATNYLSLQWTIVSGAGILTNATTLTATYTPAPADAGTTVVLRLTANGNAPCASASDNMNLQVAASPTVNAGPDGSTCVNVAYTISGAGATNYSSLLWTIVSGAGTLTNATTLTATYTPAPADAGTTVVLRLTANGNANCLPVNDNMNLLVVAAPTVNAGPDGSTCVNAAYTISGASASNYSSLLWTIVSGAGTLTNANTLTPTYTPAVADAGTTVVLRLRANGNANCAAVSDDRNLQVVAAPTVNAGPDASTCVNTAYTISGASATNYSSLQWTIVSGAGALTNATTLTATYTPAAADAGTTVVLRLTANGNAPCASASDNMNLQVRAAPTVNAGLDGSTCIGTAYTISGSSATNYLSLQWTIVSGAGTLTNATTLTATYTPVAADAGTTVVLRLTANGNAPCASVSDNMNLQVVAAPTANAGPDASTCVNVAHTISGASATNYSSLQWTIVSGAGILTNATTLTATYTPAPADAGTTVVLRLTANGNAPCASASDNMNLQVRAAPTVNAGPDASTCVSIAYTISGASTTNYSSLQWTIVSGAGTLTNATTLTATYTPVPADAGTTVVLRLTANGNANCSPATDNMNLQVVAAPTVNAGPDGSTCVNAAYTISGASATNYSSLQWTIVSGAGTLTNATTLAATYTPVPADAGTTVVLRLTANGNANCSPATDNMNLQVVVAPTVNAGPDTSTCVNTAYTISGASATNYSSLQWTIVSGAGALTNATTLTAIYTPAAADAGTTVVLRLTANGNAPCTSASDNMNLQVAATPTVNAGPDGSTCVNDAYTISGASATNYSSLQWTIVSGAGTLTNATTLTATYTPAAADAGITVVLRLRANGNASCSPVTDDMNLDVQQKPVINAGNDKTICYGSSVALNASISNYVFFSWNKGTGDGFFDDELILNPTYNPGPNDLLTGKVTLYLTATGIGSCGNEIDSITITIPPQLIATIGAPTPFMIGPGTLINVSVEIENHEAIHDLSYYLQSPDGTRVPLKVSSDYLTCNYADEANLTFTSDPAYDTLNICSIPFFPGIPLSGTYEATGDFSAFYGMDPANGAWSVIITDCSYNVVSPDDGQLTYASITFTDISYLGIPETVAYESGTISQPIYQSDVYECAETRYIAPIGLRTKCYGSCDALGLVTVVGGISPYTDYNWNPSVTTGNGKDSVYLCEGSYSLTVMDAMGCVANTTVNVSSPLPIVYDSFIATDTLNCHGISDGVIRMKASGGTGSLTYTLLPATPSSVADSGVFTGLGTGTYTLRVQDKNDCLHDTTITITEPEAFVLQDVIIDSLLCSGDTDGIIRVIAQGGKTPYTFRITPGAEINNDGLFEDLPQGNYVVRVTDAGTCGDTLVTDTIRMNSPSPLLIDSLTVDPILCNGGRGSISIHVSGGSQPYEGSVDGGAIFTASLTFSDLAPGNYTPAVRDDNACIALYTTSVSLIDPPPIIIDSLSITDITGCYGDPTGSIYIEASGGGNRIEYSLDGVTYQPGNLFSSVTGGPKTLYIRDSLGCTVIIDTLEIAQPAQLIVSVALTQAIGSTPGTITLTASGGTPPYVYSIDNGVNTQDTGYFGDLVPGLYDVFVQDAHGCIFTDTVRIILNELNVLITEQDVSCYGLSDGEFIITVQNGVPPYWMTGGFLGTDTITSTDGFFPFTRVAAGSYSFTIEDAEGRTYSRTVVINEPPEIIITGTITRPTCTRHTNDGSVDIDVSGGNPDYSYNWSNGSTDEDLVNIPEGLYKIIVEDENLCRDSANFDVVALNSATAHAGMDDTICQGVPYILFGWDLGHDAVRWEPTNLVSDSTIQAPEITLYARTEFIYTITNNTCWDKDTVVIDVFPRKNMDISSSVPYDTILYLLPGQQATLTATEGFESYYWYPNTGLSDSATQSVICSPPASLTYHVIGTTFENEGGCEEEDSISVVIAQQINIIYTGFTPNGDGVNDKWVIPHAAEYLDKIEVQVFNRWGQRLFYSRGYGGSNEWDGTFKGKPVPVGTYYFIITLDDGKTEPFTGTVTIIR